MRTELQSQKVQRYAKSPQGTVEDHDAWWMVDEDGDMVQVTYEKKGGKVPDHDVAIHSKGSDVVRYLTWFLIATCIMGYVLTQIL